MMTDKHLFSALGILLLVPIAFAFYSKDSFRYPCQDPGNWEKPICQKPLCDVTRTCIEHVFKGQRDPRLGPPPEAQNILAQQQLQQSTPVKECK
jgi:hypothetical protein